jgi:hypothetical protein
VRVSFHPLTVCVFSEAAYYCSGPALRLERFVWVPLAHVGGHCNSPL